MLCVVRRTKKAQHKCKDITWAPTTEQNNLKINKLELKSEISLIRVETNWDYEANQAASSVSVENTRVSPTCKISYWCF